MRLSTFVLNIALLSFTLFGVTPADAQVQITDCNWVANAPGDYIIANDIDCVAGDFGIQVVADNVHIDFNGMTLTGAPINPLIDVGGFGIHTSATNLFGVPSCLGVTGLQITGPGTITGWLTGVKLCASSPTEMRAKVTGMTLTLNRRFGMVLLNSDRNQVKKKWTPKFGQCYKVESGLTKRIPRDGQAT